MSIVCEPKSLKNFVNEMVRYFKMRNANVLIYEKHKLKVVNENGSLNLLKKWKKSIVKKKSLGANKLKQSLI